MYTPKFCRYKLESYSVLDGVDNDTRKLFKISRRNVRPSYFRAKTKIDWTDSSRQLKSRSRIIFCFKFYQRSLDSETSVEIPTRDFQIIGRPRISLRNEFWQDVISFNTICKRKCLVVLLSLVNATVH